MSKLPWEHWLYELISDYDDETVIEFSQLTSKMYLIL